jgi:hypothetical protein
MRGIGEIRILCHILVFRPKTDRRSDNPFNSSQFDQAWACIRFTETHLPRISFPSFWPVFIFHNFFRSRIIHFCSTIQRVFPPTIVMEQWVVACFFTPKGANPKDTHAEFLSVYGTDALVLRTVSKRHKRFAHGRTGLSMIRNLGDPGRMISPKPFALCFRNIILLQARDFMPISGLRKLRACISCTMFRR